MTADLVIGRVGSALDVDAPQVLGVSGDRMKVGGWLEAGSLADAKVLRDQVLGLWGDRDEPIKPVTYASDTTLNGFYEVLGVQVDDVLGQSETVGGRKWSADLRRVPGWQAPLIESKLVGALRSNSHSIVTGSSVPFLAVPSACGDGFNPGGTGSLTMGSRTSATGGLHFAYGANSLLYDTIAGYYLAPGDFYDGSPLIEVSTDSGSTWRAVSGRLMRNTPDAVRISNGLIRFTMTTAGALFTKCEVYNGSAWEDVEDGGSPAVDVTPYLTYAGATHTAFPSAKQSIVVEQAHSAVATVKLTWNLATPAAVDVYLTLRRGDRMGRFVVMSQDGVLSTKWGMQWARDLLVTTASLTGGSRLSGNDANGNRWVMATPAAFTNDSSGATNSYYRDTDNIAWSFAFGVELDGSGSSGQNTAQNIAYQYFAAQQEQVFVTGRG